MIALLSAALAAGAHSGIPMSAVPGLSDVSFTHPDHGWAGTLPGGWLRVYVGATEADADRWYEAAIGALTVAPGVAAPLADESTGDGERLFAFRDGNVAALVRLEEGARARAAALQAAIVDGVAPSSGRVVERGGTWTVDAPWALGIVRVGGQPVLGSPGTWQDRPEVVYALDPLGRVVALKP